MSVDDNLKQGESLRAGRGAMEPEALLNALVASSYDAIIGKTLDGTIVVWNAAAERLYGYSAAEAVGRSISVIVPATKTGELDEIMKQVRNGRRVEPFETIRIRKDGTPIPISLTLSPVRDENGVIVGASSIARDISEQKRREVLERLRTEHALKEVQKRLQLFAEHSSDLLLVTSVDLEILYVSPACLKMLGYEPEELVGRDALSLIDTEGLEQAEAAYASLMSGEDVAYTGYAIHKEGHRVWVESRSHAIIDADTGTVRELQSLIRDVSERRRIEQAQERLASLQRAERDWLRQVIRYAPAFMVTLRGPDHVFEFVNEQYYQLVGHRDIVGKSVLEGLPEVVGQGFLSLLDQVYHTGEPYEGDEIPVVIQPTREAIPDERYINLTYLPLYELDGTISGILAHGVDVTEQVLTRRRLELLHRIDQAILAEQSPESIAEVALELLQELVSYEQAAIALFDYEAETYSILSLYQGLSTGLLSPGQSRPLAEHGHLDALIAGETIYTPDLQAVMLNCAMLQTLKESGVRSHVVIPLMVGDDCLGAFHLTSKHAFTECAMDVAEEAALSLAVAIQSAQLAEEVNVARHSIEALTRRLVESQEQERRRLALELHDEMGQMLTAIRHLLEREGDEEGPVARARYLVDKLTRQVRSLSLDLRPALLDDLGLFSALEWYFHRYHQQTDVEVDFAHAGLEARPLPSTVKITAFRIIQEALTNVARHAGVDRVSVKVLSQEEHLFLRIEDAGRGFDAGQHRLRETGGLSGLQERARLLGGKVSIETMPDNGTRVIVTLPIAWADAEGENEGLADPSKSQATGRPSVH